jgi:hypothetical protein
MAGDSTTNLIESVHRDTNREGIHCTLLGGLQKGQAFDSWKIRTLEVTKFCLLDDLLGSIPIRCMKPTVFVLHMPQGTYQKMPLPIYDVEVCP